MAKEKTTQKRLKIDELVDNPRNPRNHPEEQLRHLRASIKRFGQPRPILVRAASNMIIAGHGLKAAMKLEGKTEIDVIAWDCTQKEADAFMVADNQLPQGATDDLDRIAEILKEQGEAELVALGFDADILLALSGEGGQKIVVEEIPTGDVEARFWITVRGPLKQQAKALKRLKDAMADLGDVKVELGTTLEG